MVQNKRARPNPVLRRPPRRGFRGRAARRAPETDPPGRAYANTPHSQHDPPNPAATSTPLTLAPRAGTETETKAPEKEKKHRAEMAQYDVKICCMGAGYVGGPTMAVIAKMCPKAGRPARAGRR